MTSGNERPAEPTVAELREAIRQIGAAWAFGEDAEIATAIGAAWNLAGLREEQGHG